MPWKLIVTGLIGVAAGVGAAVAVMRDIPKRLEENEKLTWHHDDRIAALEARLTLLEESPKVKALVCEGMTEVDPPKKDVPEKYNDLVEEYAPSDEPPSDVETLTDVDGLSIEDYEFINSSNDPVDEGMWDVKYDAALDVLYDEDDEDISAEKPALRAFLAQWFQGDSEARYAEIGENGQDTPVRVMIVPDEYGEAWYD
jgi:hypothetical protein|nr:MAG TPA: hypothetical protein [Caudoviricetes sp.]